MNMNKVEAEHTGKSRFSVLLSILSHLIRNRVKGMKKLNLLQLIFFLMIFITTSVSQETYCGSIRVQNNASDSSILKHMILCKSKKLYFRTSIGLFPVSSIDYTNKILTVSHTSCSSASNFLSPHHLSAGFPPPSTPNSLLLFNCSNQTSKKQFLQSCNDADRLSGCNNSSAKGLSSCSVIEDVSKLEKGVHPKQMNCTHYSAVYRNIEKFEVGTRISFDIHIPDHVPNPCNECEKRDGNCGAGLRCVCYPKKCKDKVISGGNVLNLYGNMPFYYLVLFIVVMGLF